MSTSQIPSQSALPKPTPTPIQQSQIPSQTQFPKTLPNKVSSIPSQKQENFSNNIPSQTSIKTAPIPSISQKRSLDTNIIDKSINSKQ
jgi:hypothetical protein